MRRNAFLFDGKRTDAIDAISRYILTNHWRKKSIKFKATKLGTEMVFQAYLHGNTAHHALYQSPTSLMAFVW
jgi:hypothetical protein